MKFTEMKDLDVIKAEMIKVFGYHDAYNEEMEYRTMPDGVLLGFVTGRGWDEGDVEVADNIVSKYCVDDMNDAVVFCRLLDTPRYEEYHNWLLKTIEEIRNTWMDEFEIPDEEWVINYITQGEPIPLLSKGSIELLIEVLNDRIDELDGSIQWNPDEAEQIREQIKECKRAREELRQL